METTNDKCVVCGESDQGKPLYKKLGSGEHNVEVIVALRELELTSLPESAKTDHYICWDCDETILQEYGRYLEYEEKRRVEDEKQKEEKKAKRREQQMKRKLQREKSAAIINTQSEKISIENLKKKPLENKRASEIHNTSHCVICDSTFETASRGYHRYSLKKSINDDMDVASVMEFLGIARRIAPEVKNKRFVCNNCFYTLRRNYKNKLLKGTSVESLAGGPPPTEVQKNPIHRATTNEHAAEIAKLLPPALAECYKIMTNDNFSKAPPPPPPPTPPKGGVKPRAVSVPARGPDGQFIAKNRYLVRGSNPRGTTGHRTDAEGEEEEGLSVSQDEHGNYLVDMELTNSTKEDEKVGKEASQEDPQLTPRKKKNVLLPKRHHHHLKENNGLNHVVSSGSPEENQANSLTDAKKDENANPTEASSSRMCNICGVGFTGKPDSWWYNLDSTISGIQSVSISMALQMLETSLANTSEEARQASHVCNRCYSMVSSGFRRQVVQRIAHEKNIDASKVNFSKVKVRLLSKEEMNKMSNKNAADGTSTTREENSDKMPLKRKNGAVEESSPKKQKMSKGEREVKDHTVKSPVRKNNIQVPRTPNRPVLERDSSPALASDGGYSEGEGDSVSSKGSDSDFEDPVDIKMEKVDQERAHKLSNNKVQRDGVGSNVPPKPINNKKVNAVGLDPLLDIKKKLKREEEEKEKEKEISNVCSVKEVLVVNRPKIVAGDLNNSLNSKVVKPIMIPNPPYDVTKECPFYFSLSQMHDVKVILKDIKSSLPPEAYDGRTVLLNPDTEDIYGRVDYVDKDLPSSSLQLILNSMLPPNCTVRKEEVKDPELEEAVVKGRCVVCASVFERALKLWHNLRDDVDPPSLRVPIRWVLASLSIAPVKLTPQEKEDGRVCGDCFSSLTKQFNEFVRVKIGESNGMEPDEVNVKEYIVSFNQQTMNIEADPAEPTPEEELEESSKVLESLEPTLTSFNIDSLLDESYVDPLPLAEFTNTLLLILNEFQVHIGASMGDLVSWLHRLMPIEYHIKHLKPCEATLLPYINSLVMPRDSSAEGAADRLHSILPESLFECTRKESRNVVKHKKVKEEVKDDEENVVWEDFLNPVNLDDLMRGKAQPLSKKHFNNGLLYALWRVSICIKADSDTLKGWLKLLSPMPLSEAHLKLLVNAPKPIHDHLQEHPEDVRKLDCVIIPESMPENAATRSKGINGTRANNVSTVKQVTTDASEKSGTVTNKSNSPAATLNNTTKKAYAKSSKETGNAELARSQLKKSPVAVKDDIKKRKLEKEDKLQEQDLKKKKIEVKSSVVSTQKPGVKSSVVTRQEPSENSSIISPQKPLVKSSVTSQKSLHASSAISSSAKDETKYSSPSLSISKSPLLSPSQKKNAVSKLSLRKRQKQPDVDDSTAPNDGKKVNQRTGIVEKDSSNSKSQNPAKVDTVGLSSESGEQFVKDLRKCLTSGKLVAKGITVTPVHKSSQEKQDACVEGKSSGGNKGNPTVSPEAPKNALEEDHSSNENSEDDSVAVAAATDAEDPRELAIKVKELEKLLRAMKHENEQLKMSQNIQKGANDTIPERKKMKKGVTLKSGHQNKVQKSVPTKTLAQRENSPAEVSVKRKIVSAENEKKGVSLSKKLKKPSGETESPKGSDRLVTDVQKEGDSCNSTSIAGKDQRTLGTSSSVTSGSRESFSGSDVSPAICSSKSSPLVDGKSHGASINGLVGNETQDSERSSSPIIEGSKEKCVKSFGEENTQRRKKISTEESETLEKGRVTINPKQIEQKRSKLKLRRNTDSSDKIDRKELVKEVSLENRSEIEKVNDFKDSDKDRTKDKKDDLYESVDSKDVPVSSTSSDKVNTDSDSDTELVIDENIVNMNGKNDDMDDKELKNNISESLCGKSDKVVAEESEQKDDEIVGEDSEKSDKVVAEDIERKNNQVVAEDSEKSEVLGEDSEKNDKVVAEDCERNNKVVAEDSEKSEVLGEDSEKSDKAMGEDSEKNGKVMGEDSEKSDKVMSEDSEKSDKVVSKDSEKSDNVKSDKEASEDHEILHAGLGKESERSCGISSPIAEDEEIPKSGEISSEGVTRSNSPTSRKEDDDVIDRKESETEDKCEGDSSRKVSSEACNKNSMEVHLSDACNLSKDDDDDNSKENRETKGVNTKTTCDTVPSSEKDDISAAGQDTLVSDEGKLKEVGDETLDSSTKLSIRKEIVSATCSSSSPVTNDESGCSVPPVETSSGTNCSERVLEEERDESDDKNTSVKSLSSSLVELDTQNSKKILKKKLKRENLTPNVPKFEEKSLEKNEDGTTSGVAIEDENCSLSNSVSGDQLSSSCPPEKDGCQGFEDPKAVGNKKDTELSRPVKVNSSSGKLTIPKKPKPLFEDLMTYDASS